MKLTRDDVLKLAKLSRLKLKNDEIESFQNDISEILNYVEILQSVDTDGLKPTYQVTGLFNVTRPDEEVTYGPTPDALLKNVPHKENNFIKVKRMIG
ncbi:MAG: Asp-tRNA(Asn)/Glu-tRNA(Gln) amidotransferase subunit GatC [bacterium]|nr:Asp-tRNA(Asn)/Glu-tRNA(Gln) amidotransferase subunit GatC [bacterium]